MFTLLLVVLALVAAIGLGLTGVAGLALAVLVWLVLWPVRLLFRIVFGLLGGLLGLLGGLLGLILAPLGILVAGVVLVSLALALPALPVVLLALAVWVIYKLFFAAAALVSI